jgi:hypothetical protein
MPPILYVNRQFDRPKNIPKRFCPNDGVPMRQFYEGDICDKCGLFINWNGKRASRSRQIIGIVVCSLLLFVIIVIAYGLGQH